jgi:ribosomal protein S18 acetylase RimI-like enzyme
MGNATIHELKLKDLQPSQFYISEKKLKDIEAWLNPADLSCFEPIPVKLLDGRPVMTDGHTRAVAALRAGLEVVPLVWDEDELSWDMYRACVAACREHGIESPRDLMTRIISEEEYREKWDKWCDRMQAEVERNRIIVKPYTEPEIPDGLAFERALRAEEDFWGWEIDDAYIAQVQKSFEGDAFRDALSFLAYMDGQAVGRIDACLIRSHFDGSTKAYLDWICVLKSYRHRGVAQALLERLRQELKARGVDTLIALTASNEEAQRFYRSVPDSVMRDTGIWIDI